MEITFVEIQSKEAPLGQPNQPQIDVLNDLQLALVGGGIGTVLIG